MDPMTRVLFGEHAVHVPAWLYVQGGDSTPIVQFAGASNWRGTGPNPARFGSSRIHQFVLGEIVIRPHLVIGTDALRGDGIGNLARGAHNFDRILSDGEVVLDPIGKFAVEADRWAGR